MTRPATVFVLCLLTYLANGRPHPEVDCVAAPYTAWSLVRHGSYDLSSYLEIAPYIADGAVRLRPDGGWVSMRPPGAALTAVPFVAPLAFFRARPPRDQTMHQLGKLAAAVTVAGAAALIFLICRRLAPAAAWPAAILFGLGTCLTSVASQALWMHGPATFWLCAALYLLTHERHHDAWRRVAAGLALGLAVLTRPTTAFFSLATVLTLLAQRRWRGAACLCLGGLLPAMVLFHYNWASFDSPFLGGYENDNWVDAPPWWLGLGGLLVAPSRGAFVYSPALLVALPGALNLMRGRDRLRESRTVLLTWSVAAGVTLLFFARWHDWWGGWCYGPRFLCETMPVWCLLFALAYGGLHSRWQRAGANLLVTLSIAVHLIGLFGYSGYEAWQRRHAQPDHGRSLFALHDTQIEAHARALLRKLALDRAAQP